MRRLRCKGHSFQVGGLLLSLLLVACAANPQGEDAGPGADAGELACTYRFVFDDGRAHTQVALAGTFNGWSESADRLGPGEGSGFVLERALPTGAHAYHFLVEGRVRFDPVNHRRTFQSGREESLLLWDACEAPRLEVERFELDPGGHLRARVVFVPGRSGDAADPASAIAKLDGAVLPASTFVGEPAGGAGSFMIDVQGLAPGKHRLALAASDVAGREASPLLLSAWAEAEPFSWNGALLYFPMTDRYRDGDLTNDAPSGVAAAADYRGGDWAGITAAIEAGTFEDLGVTALWLSPLAANPDGAFPGSDGRFYTGYHGYWPSSARTPQPRFGTLADLQALTAAAHARGLRVLADLVFNHVHAEHPYAARPGWTNGDGQCVCGSAGCGWDEQPLVCWFTDYLPDLDWRSDAVAEAMVDDALWWLDTADLDGFRVDAVKHFETRALFDLRAALARREAAGSTPVFLIGETFVGEGDRDPVAAFVGPGKLDGQFDFPLYWTALRVLARDEGSFIDLEAAVVAGEARWPEGSVMSPFLGNHDVPRFLSHAAGDITDLYGGGAKQQGWDNPPGAPATPIPYERAALAFAWLLTAPGLPLIYYGDEVGLPGAGDPDNRRMMRFGTDLSTREAALQARVQILGRLRRATPALRTGQRRTLLLEPDLWVQVRDAGGARQAVVAINRSGSAQTRTVTLDGALAGLPRLTFDARLTGGRVVATAGQLTFTLAPRSAEVFTPAP